MLESAEIGHRDRQSALRPRGAATARRTAQRAVRPLAVGRGPVLLIISGVEGGGRGETANKLTEWMDPRHIRVIAFGDRTPEEERAHPTLWRYWRSAAAARQDRHFHERLVQRAAATRMPGQGASTRRLRRLHARHPRTYEQMLADEGVIVLKFWIHLSKDAQKTAARGARRAIRRRRWRVTEDDWRALQALRQVARRLGARCCARRRPARRRGTWSRAPTSATATSPSARSCSTRCGDMRRRCAPGRRRTPTPRRARRRSTTSS